MHVEVGAEEVGEAGRDHRADAEQEAVEDTHVTAILRPHDLDDCNKHTAPTRQSLTLKGSAAQSKQHGDAGCFSIN